MGATSTGAYSGDDLVFLCLLPLLIIIQVAIKRHHVSLSKTIGIMRGFQAAVVNLACNFCWGKGMVYNFKGDPLRHDIQQAVAKDRVDGFQRYLIMIQTSCLIGCVHAAVMRASHAQRHATSWQDGLLCTYYLFILVLAAVPALVHDRMLNLWHLLIMVGVTMSTVPGIGAPDYLPIANDISLLTCWFASLNGMRLPLVVLWGFIRWTMQWPVVQSVEGGNWTATSGARFIEMVAVCFHSWVIEKQRYEKSRKAVEARLLMQRQSANDALLSTFYDVVVEVNATLEIGYGAAELARFLYSPGVVLDGVNFIELLPLPEDQEVFKERMRQPVDSQEARNIMHMTLSCNAAQSRQLEIFSYQYVSGGCSRHLLGIRDSNEDLMGAPLPSRSNIVADEEAMNLPSLPAEVTVLVDSAAERTVPILGCSDGFGRIVGTDLTVTGTHLGHVVSHIDQLQEWMQRVQNTYWSGDPLNELERINSFNLVLLPQSAHPVRGTCKILFQDDEVNSNEEQQGERHADLDEDVLPVQLSICHLQQGLRVERRWRRSRSSRPRNRGRRSLSGTPPSSPHVSLDDAKVVSL